MKIKYKESWETKYKVHTLSQMAEAKANDDYSGGTIEYANSKANVCLEFSEKIIEMLYKKGLINDDDIGMLVSEFCSCDAEEVKVIPE